MAAAGLLPQFPTWHLGASCPTQSCKTCDATNTPVQGCEAWSSDSRTNHPQPPLPPSRSAWKGHAGPAGLSGGGDSANPCDSPESQACHASQEVSLVVPRVSLHLWAVPLVATTEDRRAGCSASQSTCTHHSATRQPGPPRKTQGLKQPGQSAPDDTTRPLRKGRDVRPHRAPPAPHSAPGPPSTPPSHLRAAAGAAPSLWCMGTES